MAARRKPAAPAVILPPPAKTPRRRWLRFGPGLALVILALALLWPSLQGGLPGSGPRIDRSSLTSIPAPPAAPELSWVLEQRDSLHLSTAQVTKLSRLQNQWEGETHALREALRQETASLDRELDSQPHQGLNIREFQDRASPLSELSRRLAAARRDAWAEAALLLTSSQRQQAETNWRRHWSARP